MKLLRIRAKNVFSYSTLDIDFSNLGNVLIVGETGTGKSSIFNIVYYALYGVVPIKNYRNIIRDTPKLQNKRKAYIILDFIIDGVAYQVARNLNTKRVLIKHENNDNVEFRKKVKDSQTYINSILGFNSNLALTVLYFAQDSFGDFLNGTTKTKLEIISNIFDLSLFNRLLKSVDTDVSTNNVNIEKAFSKIEYINKNIQTIDISNELKLKKLYRSKLNGFKNKLGAIRNKLILISEKESIYNHIMSLKNDIEKIELEKKYIHNNMLTDIDSAKGISAKLKQYKAELDILKSKSNKLNVINSAISKIDEKISLYENRVNKYDRKGVEIKDEISKIYDIVNSKKTLCITCNREITLKDIEEYKIQLNVLSENIKLLERKSNKLLIKIDSLNATKKKYSSELRLYSDEQNRLAILENYIATNKDIYDKIRVIKLNAKEKMLKCDDAIIEYKNEISKVDVGRYAKINLSKKAYYNRLLNTTNENILELTTKLNNTIRNIDEYYKHAKYKKKLLILADKIGESNKIPVYWKSTLPRLRIEYISMIIPYLQDTINGYLEMLANNKRIELRIDDRKKLDNIRVIISDIETGVIREYAGYSGGEKHLLSYLCFLAFNKLLSIKASIKLNFGMLDEKFTSFDSQLRDKVLTFTREVFSDRNIYAISHLSDMSDFFDSVIYVEKINGVSRIKNIVSK